MSPIFTGVTINPSERKLLQGLVVQDVNVNKISSASIANILSQLEIDPNYCNVVGVDLVHNIEPHDDQSFCRYLGYNKAVLVVSSVKRLNKEYMDSPITSFIYTKRDGFLNIFSNKAYPFNPKKEHAMLVNGRVKGFVIFYK